MSAEERIRRRLEELRDRFVASSMRSRTIRLRRTSRSGALDMTRLREHDRRGFERLVAMMGGSDGAPRPLCDVKAQGGGEDLSEDLGRLAHAARDEKMETGADNLAVGWPILEGKTADGTWVRAPLLLYPAALDTTSSGRHQWTISPRGRPELNEPLAQTLARLEGVRMRRSDLLEFDDDGRFAIDEPTWRGLIAYLRDMELAIEPDGPGDGTLPLLRPLPTRDTDQSAEQPPGEFRLHHHLVLGRFPLSGSSVVMDYDSLLDEGLGDVLAGPEMELARDILLVDEASLARRLAEDEHDLVIDPQRQERERGGDAEVLGALRRWQVLASDSSQDAVFRHLEGVYEEAGADSAEAAADRGLVVRGPPGTGKSQLIANLVAAHIARGKRVLVVCQKRAALDVVADRLSALGVGEPLAVVHDVQRDRNDVCASIAGTLERVGTGSGYEEAELEREIEQAARAHDRTRSRLKARVESHQEAFALLAGSEADRPGLAELFERALDDDGRPLPDLSDYADTITSGGLARRVPEIESIAQETARLAAPHPLARRGDWSSYHGEGREAALRAVFGRLDRLDGMLEELAQLPGYLEPGESLEMAETWRAAAPVLEMFEEGDFETVNDFLLFWMWTDGRAATGAWHRVMSTLRQARRERSAIPYELFVEDEQQLRDWIERLDRLAKLQTKWFRWFVPEFWQLRGLPGEILDRCTSLGDESAAVPVDVAELCREALRWQEFYFSLPADNPLFDFGFQGDPAEIDAAIEELQTQHRRVQCLHDLQEALADEVGDAAASYRELPALGAASVETIQRVDFVRDALGDRRCGRLLERIETFLAEPRSLEEDEPPDRLKQAAGLGFGRGFEQRRLEEARRGDIRAAREHLQAVGEVREEAAEAARLDRQLADAPAWVVAFLRRWRPREGGAGRGDVADDVRTAVERAWRAWYLDGRSVRSVEAPLTRPERLQRLADTLQECRDHADRGILARYYKRLVDARRDQRVRRSMRRLADEARKSRYRMTLRQLVERFWDEGLAEVRPVWCCSPDSVASLFPMKPGLFDVVIFDEASQCKVESALPALLRARSAVIAGDEQQMPPSNHFQVSVDHSEARGDSILASESVLNLSRAAFPQVTLKWHYRSQHEELVAFSNDAFYSGSLVTAPGSGPRIDEGIEGLNWAPVDGIWKNNTNRKEAERVVELVDRVLRTQGPGGRPPTVGVVAFNRPQAELIEELLEARASDDAGFRDRIARDRERSIVERMFVRNLENVQGDERDIIIMSTGYGPERVGGPIHARFGPINREGGGKRLNVAITRARLGLWMVTSIKPERLDVSSTKHVGPELFKLYLRFVQASSRGEPAEVQTVLDEARRLAGRRGVAAPRPARLVEAPSGQRVCRELARRLRRDGLQVREDVGLGSHRLDLAVRRDADAAWRLGVDCREFLRRPEPLARDVYVPNFWRRQGWQIIRVAPGAWLERPDEVLARIAAAAR